MTLAEWLADTGSRVDERGYAGFRESVYELYLGALRRANRLYSGGTNVFDREWDLLILLDGCRVDLLGEVAEAYAFLDDPGVLTSVGSSSIEWTRRTFDGASAEAMDGTALVTGNPFSKRVLSSDDLLHLDEVWRYGWDDETGTIPADRVTDRAVSAARSRDADRLIVHYMQPHLPSVPTPLSDGMNADTLGDGAGWESPWDRLRRGELSFDIVWRAYRENLRYVLEEVRTLLRNVDADRAVISADHGNAAGEFGVYGHPRVPIPVVRRVPWYVTTAVDTGAYAPSFDETRADVGPSVEEKLTALGYA